MADNQPSSISSQGVKFLHDIKTLIEKIAQPTVIYNKDHSEMDKEVIRNSMTYSTICLDKIEAVLYNEIIPIT